MALGPSGGLILLSIQTLVFAFGAILGFHFHPYAALYRALLASRLKPSPRRVAERPLRFGQALGMLVAVVALLAGTVGLATVFYALTAIVLLSAASHAVFNFCIGCSMYRALLGGTVVTADLTDNSSTAPRDVPIG
jgi:hypothetical protein